MHTFEVMMVRDRPYGTFTIIVRARDVNDADRQACTMHPDCKVQIVKQIDF